MHTYLQSFKNHFCVCLCACVHMACLHLERRGQLWKLVLSFHSMGSEYWAALFSFGGKHLYQLCHFATPSRLLFKGEVEWLEVPRTEVSAVAFGVKMSDHSLWSLLLGSQQCSFPSWQSPLSTLQCVSLSVAERVWVSQGLFLKHCCGWRYRIDLPGALSLLFPFGSAVVVVCCCSCWLWMLRF